MYIEGTSMLFRQCCLSSKNDNIIPRKGKLYHEGKLYHKGKLYHENAKATKKEKSKRQHRRSL